MNTLHMLGRALGACLLIVIGSMVSNAAAWILIVLLTLPFVGLRWWRKRSAKNGTSR